MLVSEFLGQYVPDEASISLINAKTQHPPISTPGICHSIHNEHCVVSIVLEDSQLLTDSIWVDTPVIKYVNGFYVMLELVK